MPEEVLLPDSLHIRHGAEDRIQRSDPQRTVIGDGNAVLARAIRFENNVASFLIHAAIAVVLSEQFDQLRLAEITRQLHATAITSSRTRCRRMTEGLG